MGRITCRLHSLTTLYKLHKQRVGYRFGNTHIHKLWYSRLQYGSKKLLVYNLVFKPKRYFERLTDFDPSARVIDMTSRAPRKQQSCYLLKKNMFIKLHLTSTTLLFVWLHMLNWNLMGHSKEIWYPDLHVKMRWVWSHRWKIWTTGGVIANHRPEELPVTLVSTTDVRSIVKTTYTFL